MLHMSKSEARRRFAEVIGRAARDGQRTVVTHYGKPVAVVGTVEDLRRLDPNFVEPTTRRRRRPNE